MTREDEEAFVDYLFSAGDVWLVRDQWYATRKYEAYNDARVFFDQPVVDERHKTSIWLIWNRTVCKDRLVMCAVPGQPFYEIAQNANHVVEFTRCVVKNDALQIGRIACLDRYEDETGILHEKEPDFIKWYGWLDRWIAERGVRASFDGVHAAQKLLILPGALQYYQQGAKLGSIAGKAGAFQPLRKNLA